MEGPFVQIPSASFVQGETTCPIAFLDRDGVINRGKAGYVNHPEEVQLLPGASASVAALNAQGYKVCVVTNQSPISRGLWPPQRLADIHEELQSQLLREHPEAVIHAYITCPHRHEERCWCRKPSPAMLHLGHAVLRTELEVPFGWSPVNVAVDPPEVDWWGQKPSPEHPLDLMVGDRRSDMGAGWAYGARLFRVSGDEGLRQVSNRCLDALDDGETFQS